ncbi:MAG: T9SS C-terminal target domain-containing protein [Bacteroidetes bacterium]|nr:MAG: T9SS C-terminal target domain-containing protein [Bacteroidota bacterium]TAG85792.1 MAG: T9SS C-terminal target domain-containing protein [Bacteroidota bacterium]
MGGWVLTPSVYIYTGTWDFKTNIISTNPDASYNPERPDVRNRFDWRRSPFTAFYPNRIGPFGGTTPKLLTNPYYDTDQETLRYFNLMNTPVGPNMFDPEKMDFHPKDGWELLHRHFGYNPDEVTTTNPATDSRIHPYLLLYNRYTGKIRQVAYLPSLAGQQLFMKVSHKVDQNPTPSSPKYSSLFNGYDGLFRALDRQTRVAEVSSPTKPGAYDGSPAAADFDVSYDPCVCNHKSELLFTYETVLTADLRLEGRLVGINSPLNGSGTSPVLNTQDFLWQVTKPGFSVNGGRQTYFNIDKLVAKYKEPPKTSPSFGQLIRGGLTDLLKLGIGAISGGIDGWLAGKVEKLARSLVPRTTSGGHCSTYVDDSSHTCGPVSKPWFNPEIIKIGSLGLTGLSTNYFNSVLTPEQPKFNIPNISFLEAEGVFTGTAVSNFTNNSNSIRLLNPGSKDSNLPGIPWQFYPFYNEALGIFAVLRTPKIDTYVENLAPNSNGGYNRYKFSLRQDIKYTFNPAADIDENKTQISASLIFKVSKKSYMSGPSVNSDGLMYMGDNGAEYIYQSAMFPLSCMPKQVFRLGFYNYIPDAVKVKPEIRLMIRTVTNGASGKVNYGLRIFTYDADLLSVPRYDQPNGLFHGIYINGNYHNNSFYTNDNQWLQNNWNLEASHLIQISNALITEEITQGKPVRVSAQEVDLIPTGEIRERDIIGSDRNPGEPTEPGEVKAYIDIAFDTDITAKQDECKGLARTVSVPAAYVKSFCQSNDYKADQLEQKVQKEIEQGNEMRKSQELRAQEELMKVTIHPNPASDFTKVSYELFEEEPITITIKSVSGENVMTLVDNDIQKAGNHTIEFEVKSLLPGMYFCVFSNGKINKTEKLMIIK